MSRSGILLSRMPSTTSLHQESSVSSPADSAFSATEVLHLPDEIILEILSHFPTGEESQGTLWSCCLVSRQWHNLSIARLYEEPYLYGSNYDPFVRTVCPSLNAHIRKSDLAGLVRTLDMSHLAYQGSRSTTARLLGRTKDNVRKFIAPQANWGVNCLAALSRCTKLQHLNLSLISEALGYQELSNAIQRMTDLRTLRFPRSAAKEDMKLAIFPRVKMHWPAKLEDLTLSGDLRQFVMWDVSTWEGARPNLPWTIHHLSFEHTNISSHGFQLTLQQLGGKLTSLKVTNMTNSHFGWPQDEGASILLHLCPNLNTLTVSADLLTFTFIADDEDTVLYPVTRTHQLKHLYIATPARSGHYIHDELLETSDIAWAVEEGAFPMLRTVTIETYFNAPKEWAMGDLELHERLKQRAADVGEDACKAGVRWAVLQPS